MRELVELGLGEVTRQLLAAAMPHFASCLFCQLSLSPCSWWASIRTYASSSWSLCALYVLCSGVGNDPRASRYFSIPRQQEKFDKNYEYVNRWLNATPPQMLSPTQVDQHYHKLIQDRKAQPSTRALNIVASASSSSLSSAGSSSGHGKQKLTLSSATFHAPSNYPSTTIAPLLNQAGRVQTFASDGYEHGSANSNQSKGTHSTQSSTSSRAQPDIRNFLGNSGSKRKTDRAPSVSPDVPQVSASASTSGRASRSKAQKL